MQHQGEKDEIEITKPIVAGSSTYDLVLRKTNEADPSEVIYASSTAAAVSSFINSVLWPHILYEHCFAVMT